VYKSFHVMLLLLTFLPDLLFEVTLWRWQLLFRLY